MQNGIKKKKRKGFTLIELIIVLAVLAIIAAIAIPNFMAVRNNARNKADVQSCETIKRTVLMLVSDGTVTTPASGSNADYSVTINSSGKVIVKSTATGGAENSDMEDALKDVNAPQAGSQKYDVATKSYTKIGATTSAYYIRITSDGDVIVQTDSAF